MDNTSPYIGNGHNGQIQIFYRTEEVGIISRRNASRVISERVAFVGNVCASEFVTAYVQFNNKNKRRNNLLSVTLLPFSD
jgi:hypothetical protein